jgi:hypothetical protein
MLHADSCLTPDLEAELKHLCGSLPDAELVALVQAEPALLAGGFRADKPAAVRTRLWQVAVGPQPVSDPVRRLLAAHSLNRPLVARLSRSVLLELRHELAALFGGSRLLLAMLLDERTEVREVGARWTKGDQPFTAVAPARAVTTVREAFARLLDAVDAAAPGSSGALPLTREAWRDEKERLGEQLREARAENRRLKAVEERLARTRDQLKTAEAGCTETRTRLDEMAGQLRQAARERDETRIELAREQTHREARLCAAVDARLATEFAGWLASARSLEAAARTPAMGLDDALARAEAALARQAAEDRHSGNRACLRTRLDQVEAVLDRVRDSLAAALHQTPDLRQAENDLAEEAKRLRRLLGCVTPATPFEAALAAHFNGAHANDLPHLRALVDRLAGIGALDKPSLDRLEALLVQRQAIAQATGDQPEEPDGATTGLLQSALAGRRPAILLVDGHNALFGLQGRYLAPQGSAVPDGNKRTRLVADIVHRFKGHPACRAWIVFDGPEASDASPAPNVRVTYSGGQGANRADGVLLDNVRFFRAVDPTIPILLVSNDNALGAEARRLGAQTLSALELGAVL